MFNYIVVVSTSYILLISICPMLKTGKLHNIDSSAILVNLFKNYFKCAKIRWLFAQLYKIWWLFAQLYFCVESLNSRHCE